MNKELEIKKEVSPVVLKAQQLEITSKLDLNEGVEMLSQCNKFLDKLTEEKEKLTKPLNATLKEIRSRYKPVEEVLNEAIGTLKKKMSVYQMKVVKEQEEAEVKIATEVAEGKLDVDMAIEKLEKIDSPDNKVNTEDGSVAFRTVKKFEIEDLSKVPIEYLEPNETMIRKAMNDGIELPGIKYYEEQNIINYR